MLIAIAALGQKHGSPIAQMDSLTNCSFTQHFAMGDFDCVFPQTQKKLLVRVAVRQVGHNYFQISVSQLCVIPGHSLLRQEFWRATPKPVTG